MAAGESRDRVPIALREEFHRREISRRLSRRLGFVLTVELVAGFLLSVGVVLAFAKIVKDVVAGESHRFNRVVLLWIEGYFPGWLLEPMLLVTYLGYYQAILPLLIVAAYGFYRAGARASAVLLPVATVGSIVLTDVLKRVFQRARPELLDVAYAVDGYSFPSGHATLAAGFYGTLTLLLARRLRGPARWAMVAAGVLLVLLIGLSRLYLGAHYPTDACRLSRRAPLDQLRRPVLHPVALRAATHEASRSRSSCQNHPGPANESPTAFRKLPRFVNALATDSLATGQQPPTIKSRRAEVLIR